MSSSLPSEFTLSHRVLERIFAGWSIHPEEPGLRLFAFRGALPVDVPAEGTGWCENVQLRLDDVDHLHMRCTIGIWDPEGRRLYAAPGSTVPHSDNVEKAARTGGKGANQLEPGWYADLTKGEHLQGKRNGHEALRQTANRFYQRAPKGLPYKASSPLFFGNPYDNLHCGWNLDATVAGFSSAGCLVVAGLPHCPRRESPGPNQGHWKIFHDLIYAADRKKFPLLLLPAKEAVEFLMEEAKAAARGQAKAGGAKRLVFGSSGEAVKRLQARLAKAGRYLGRISGRLDARTYRAWKGQ